MKTKFWLAAIALSMTFFAACDKDDDDNNIQPATLNAADIQFLNRFTQSNRAGISLGELARDSARDTQVGGFAQQMIQENQNAQRTLDSIGGSYNISLPAIGDTASVNFGNMLRGYSRGNVFDSAYIANQVILQDATLVDLNRAVSEATNDRIKNYANQQISVVTMRRTMADSIARKF